MYFFQTEIEGASASVGQTAAGGNSGFHQPTVPLVEGIKPAGFMDDKNYPGAIHDQQVRYMTSRCIVDLNGPHEISSSCLHICAHDNPSSVSPRSEKAYKELTSQLDHWIEGLNSNRMDSHKVGVWVVRPLKRHLFVQSFDGGDFEEHYYITLT